jgi:hypothetical protein
VVFSTDSLPVFFAAAGVALVVLTVLLALPFGLGFLGGVLIVAAIGMWVWENR